MLSEIDNYRLRLEDLRGQVMNLIADLPAEALNWRPTERIDDHATNSLAAMAAHVAGAEHFWMAETIGRQPSTRDREAEFVTQVADSSDLLQQLRSVGEETEKIFSALTPTDLADIRQVRGQDVAVRWGILHVIDHTALHLGHMQVTFQLWRGGVGTQAPRWFQRLPKDK